MNVQFVTKRLGDVFEGALIVDGKFERSGSGQSMGSLFDKLVGPIMAQPLPDGSEVAMTINITVNDQGEVPGPRPK